jgi:hypothetical protein
MLAPEPWFQSKPTEELLDKESPLPSVITLKPAIRYQFKTGHGIGLRRDCFTLPQRTFASRGLSD